MRYAWRSIRRWMLRLLLIAAVLEWNLSDNPPSLTLLSQYMPAQYAALRSGTLRNLPDDLVRSKILEVIDIYARATCMRRDSRNNSPQISLTWIVSSGFFP